MKGWQTLLRENDPAGPPPGGDDARLSPDEADRLRRSAVDAARELPAAPFAWRRPLAVAAIIALIVGSGVVFGRRMARGERVAAPAQVEQAPGTQRQLQFSTPGGTRIIWVFNSEFDLNETMP